MGFLDKLLGREPGQAGTAAPTAPGRAAGNGAPAGREPDGDKAAIERYRYLLRTAPPDRIEQAHAEAFERLTPEQRRQVLGELGSQVPEEERATSDDPRSLARMATRAEVRQPGTMERALGRGGAGGGIGLGGVLAGSLLASVAGAFVGTAIASQMLDDSSGDDSSGDEAGGDENGGENGGDGTGGDGTGGDQAGADGAGAEDPLGSAQAGGEDVGFDGAGFDGGGDSGGFDGGMGDF